MSKRAGPNQTIEFFFNSTRNLQQSVIRTSQQDSLSFIKSTPKRAVKEIQIAGLSDETIPQDDFFDSIWQELQQGIDIIFTSDPLEVKFNTLYRNVEFFCRFKKSTLLYERFVPYCEKIIDSFVQELSNLNDLETISDRVSKFEESVNNVRKVFMCFDRSYLFITRHCGFSSIPEIVYSHLTTSLDQTPVLQTLIDLLCSQISLYRANEQLEGNSLHIILQFLIEVKLYKYFEPRLIEETKDFYNQISSNLSLSDFLDFITSSLKREEGLVNLGLPEDTHHIIIQAITENCLLGHLDIIFGPEFDKAFDYSNKFNKYSDLSKIYQFFKGDQFSQFEEHLSSHYIHEVESIFLKPKGEWIDCLLDSYSHAINLIKTAFESSDQVLQVLKAAYHKAFSSKATILPHLLARKLCRSTDPEKSELYLFKLIPMQELFEQSYKFYLGKKIISGVDFNIDREDRFIKKLTKISGSDFTVHLKEMLKDVSDSAKVDIGEVKGLHFSALVISARNYPGVNFLSDKIQFPKIIEMAQNSFEKNYISKFKYRRLVWCPEKSKAKIQFGPIAFSTNGVQALILNCLQVESTHKLSCQQIFNLTKINSESLKNNLELLCSSKSGEILMKTEDDQYTINYSHKLKGGEILPEPLVKIQEEEDRELHVNRENIITNMTKCSIMKYLKEFKILSLNELFAKVSGSMKIALELGKFLSVLRTLQNMDYVRSKDQKTFEYVI